ncbi:hypothetical protein ACFYY1_20065 [Streptomyces sp. NPDC001890]|uniref:hypothetical protein n=1 Tax=Streptomyces sp. NPDC001890 TaxID=3364620 RepID=UPI0036ACF991
MAVGQLSAAPCAPHVPLPAPPHPMANPGYGKRSAPGQHPRTDGDFAHLPAREASIAAYLDRLPEGSDISVKTLAKHLPYGQCALRTALNRLQDAGHLRRGSECVANDEVLLWVTRTFFSRTARDDDWWAAFTRGDVPVEQPRRPTRSRAFALLAALGRTAPTLTLSAADCAALEPQVGEWFERGATEAELLHALTDGLPTPVHHAAALVRRRLADKMPPERFAPPQQRTVLRTLECSECRSPGSAEALIGGRCGPCRGESAAAPAGPSGAVPADGVRNRMNDVRAGLVRRSVRPGRPGRS